VKPLRRRAFVPASCQRRRDLAAAPPRGRRFSSLNRRCALARSPLRAARCALRAARCVQRATCSDFCAAPNCEVALRYYRPRAAVLSWVAADKSAARRGIRGARSGENVGSRGGKSAKSTDRAREIGGSRARNPGLARNRRIAPDRVSEIGGSREGNRRIARAKSGARGGSREGF